MKHRVTCLALLALCLGGLFNAAGCSVFDRLPEKVVDEGVERGADQIDKYAVALDNQSEMIRKALEDRAKSGDPPALTDLKERASQALYGLGAIGLAYAASELRKWKRDRKVARNGG